MRINREALPSAADPAATKGGRLSLDLGTATPTIVRIGKTQRDPLGFMVYEGAVEGDAVGSFNLVLQNGVASGSIDSAGQFFRITHVEGDLVAVVELDRSVFPNEAPPLVPPLPRLAPPPSAADAEAAAEVNVMIAYTSTARQAAGGVPQIEADARLAVSQMNQALANSGQNVSVRLTGIVEVEYAETGNADTDLKWLRTNPQVAKFRSSWKADGVSMLVESMNNACGLGYVMTNVSTAFAPYAFNVTQRGCATSNYSYAHETGHNVGCQHDRANAGFQGAYAYSYGYQAPNRAFRTTLAYNCAGGNCPRVLYYSNPNVSYGGQPTGVSSTAANSADNAMTIANTAPVVAQFHTTLPSNTFGDYNLNSNPSFAGLDPGYSDMPRFQVDVNADSRADYCRFVGNSPNTFLSCALATANGFGNYDLNSGAGPANFDPGYSTMARFMADVNADNRADYCRFVGTAPNIFFSCALATASGFGNYDLSSGQGAANLDPGYGNMPSYLVDVNADNRADYCRFVGTSPNIFLSCAFASASGFGNYNLSSGQGAAKFDLGYDTLPRSLADVNADGRADYCRFVGNAPNVFLSCAFASAAGFGNYDLSSGQGPANFDNGYTNLPIAMVDVNADRRADYCRFVGNSPYAFLSCALAGTTAFGNYDVNSPIAYDQGFGDMLRSMADVNADGKADYCRFVGNSPGVYLSCGFSNVNP
jgi:hypothetical protein